ncbi:hypothetical protein F8R89_00215 [Streptomyces sp. SS1-1]|uniref:hypothetical protein n=1 Tax=Streptomyces sp. SS1-1 TaxID=2651869 RepID=UPI00124FE5A8|nr:hypothetical protein [Streptomyces sp. SS1-1]KAB2977533.1 hypothetical protein F8R89_00215 [Streptomyces sp. SS1-1]
MNTFAKRVSLAVASVAIAGGATLAAPGHAMAASGNLGHHSETDGRDDRRAWSADQAHPALSAQERDHRWDERQRNNRTWDKVEYRWDGHRLYRLMDGRWIDVTPYRHGVVDRWYVDQLIMTQH